MTTSHHADRAAAAAAGAEHAAAASLRYVTDSRPGIRRVATAASFRYVSPDGKAVRDGQTLARIRSIGIPPAWTSVWICPAANGHVQATGRDAKGRKQHRYHARWRAVRDENKNGRLARFARALPGIRRRVAADLSSRGMSRERVLAMVVRLLETTYIRIGNEAYARTNQSYGLTTLTDDHVQIRGARIRFAFRGKSGKDHDVEVNDTRLARLVRRSRDLPGEDLFQYVDDEGAPHPITSGDVNAYIREIAGEDFTAKDFRTWAGTMLAAHALSAASEAAGGRPLPKRAVAAAVKQTAAALRNTPAVCRKCYIHPAVVEAFENPQLLDTWRAASRRAASAVRGLSAKEGALVRYLENRGSDREGRKAA
ncbi:MAG TPA: hypothetical protein VE869_00490 [Gemmatimonas sp.]|nr:hypothetical protein [Gemmatimonas sp.]